MEKEEQERMHANDIEIVTEKGIETVRVPILKQENIGTSMAIDEKQIGEDMHTIISNRETGKIAVLVRSVNGTAIGKVLDKVKDKLDKIETVTRDMSATFKKLCNDKFFNASQISDKYHIVSSAIESNQDVRVRYRQEALREKRIRQQEKKKQNKAGKVDIDDEIEKEEVLSNGETTLEALARSRYLLFKYKSDWTVKQTERAMALFKKYPEIEKVYHLVCEFRDWIKKENVNTNMFSIKKKLNNWFKEVEIAGIEELLNFKAMIERDLLAVLNYFRYGATNAIAENINSKIQRFVMINQGTRDREFFYFRVDKYFS